MGVCHWENSGPNNEIIIFVFAIKLAMLSAQNAVVLYYNNSVYSTFINVVKTQKAKMQ